MLNWISFLVKSDTYSIISYTWSVFHSNTAYWSSTELNRRQNLCIFNIQACCQFSIKSYANEHQCDSLTTNRSADSEAHVICLLIQLDLIRASANPETTVSFLCKVSLVLKGSLLRFFSGLSLGCVSGTQRLMYDPGLFPNLLVVQAQRVE